MRYFDKIKKIFIKNKKQLTNASFSYTTTKHTVTSSCTLEFSTETEKLKKEINEKLKPLIKKYINNPNRLLQYIQLKGLKTYKFNNASKFLNIIGEEAGFLTPLKGYKAFLLNLVLGFIFDKKFKISFSTKEMLIFDSGSTEIYAIARALHKYYGYKNKLPGYDYKSQETFKKVYASSHNNKQSSLVQKISLKEMFACKEALARDLESINFTLELSMEHERAKKALKKIQEENSAQI